MCPPGTFLTLLLIYLEAKELMKCCRPLHQADSPVWLLAADLGVWIVEFCFSPTETDSSPGTGSWLSGGPGWTHPPPRPRLLPCLPPTSFYKGGSQPGEGLRT